MSQRERVQPDETDSGYKKHHYVPRWYQKGFIPPDSKFQELYLLDLNPGTVQTPSGKKKRRNLTRTGTKNCFALDDLYTTTIGDRQSRDLETGFFGEVDTKGSRALRFFSDYDFNGFYESVLGDFMIFLSSQKLRTPKGLDWLTNELGKTNREDVLENLRELRSIFGAIWIESVWQIAEADSQDVGFIVSDHPVTVYNHAYAPGHPSCRRVKDPDIRHHGTHTIFPLTSSKVLLLTNRTWACDPHRSATEIRPNPRLDRSATFSFLDIHTGRLLSTDEVRAINWIIKKRALRYVAAGQEEWLFPERHRIPGWRAIGQSHLLMPDPRNLIPSSEMTLAYSDGSFSTSDAFGRVPGHPEFGFEMDSQEVRDRHHEWCDEFESLVGSSSRGEPWDKP